MATFIGTAMMSVLNLVCVKLIGMGQTALVGIAPNENPSVAFLDLGGTILRVDSEEYGRTVKKDRLVVRGIIGGLLSDASINLDPNSKPSTLAGQVLEFLPVLDLERQTTELANSRRTELFTLLGDQGAVFSDNGVEVKGATLQVSANGDVSISTGNLTQEQVLAILNIL